MWFIENCVLLSQINPSLLVKKDRGRPGATVFIPKHYGESNVFSNVPNVELLQESDNESGSDGDQDDDGVELPIGDDVEQELIPGDCGSEDKAEEDSNDGDDMNNTEDDSDIDTSIGGDEDEEVNDSDEADTDSENEEIESEEEDGEASDSSVEDSGNKEKAKGKKRKIVDFDANLLSADTSLRALKRFAEAKNEKPSFDEGDGILSNEDFRKIKTLQVLEPFLFCMSSSFCFVNKSNVTDVVCRIQAKKEAKIALARKGFKVPNSDQLSKKRVDPAKLEVSCYYEKLQFSHKMFGILSTK